ncbi:MAG TPA: MarR family transcriptional regulator [Saprospiraceae bacterium]|nr:MarR family transcriptional regulator [Saprospiraceae bacterium]HMQ82372.1 MarR family transcriptional regulator [Saprospiraceae bacterium]
MQPNNTCKAGNNPLDSLVFLTNRVGRLLANEIRKQSNMEEDWGIQPHHIGILVDLWMYDGLRQQDLVISLIKDKGTIARALDALENQGFLTRVADTHDKRNKRIFLTAEGIALKEQLWPYAQLVMQQATSGIDAHELEVCKCVLQKIYHRLNVQDTKPTYSKKEKSAI